MKKAIFCFIVLLSTLNAISQQDTSVKTFTKEDYLKKSKDQKTGAWILLSGGVVLAVTGYVVYLNSIENSDDLFKFLEGKGLWISALGLVAMSGSSLLFAASKRNRRKAMSMTFSNDMVPQLVNGELVSMNIFSVSLKIPLGCR